MEQREFKQALGRSFSVAGFLHKGQTWFKDRVEVVALANLQKSQYSAERFMNLGFWLKALGRPPSVPPGEHLCHARIRADSLFLEQGWEISELLNLQAPIPDDERTKRLGTLVEGMVVPFLELGGSLEGLRAQVVDGKFQRGFVDVDARRLMGL